MIFGEMVKEVRGRLQLTQKQLAEKLGIGYYTVNRWERGHNEPSFLMRRKFDELCKLHEIEFNMEKDI